MYFDIFIEESLIRERYRLLAKKLHPDVGGDKTIMQEINLAYEEALERVKRKEVKREPKKSPGMNYEKKIDMILHWSQSNQSFDPTFILSVRNQLIEGKSLTMRQETAIDKIIKRYRINPEESYD